MSWIAAGAIVFGAVSSNKAAGDAADASSSAARLAARQIATAGQQGRSDVETLFPSARDDLLTGSRGAFDLFNQSLGAQQQALQQGNLNAQGTVSSSLPQIQAALLGLPTNFSGFQPQGVDTLNSFDNPLAGVGFGSIPDLQRFASPEPPGKEKRSDFDKFVDPLGLF